MKDTGISQGVVVILLAYDVVGKGEAMTGVE